MGVLVEASACAKVSFLRRELPWTFGLRSKRPSTMGRSELISLTAYHDRTGLPAQKGSGCASKMGKGSSNESRGQSYATKWRRSPEKAASVLLVAGFAPSMTIACAFSTHSLGGFRSKPRAPLMLFLRCQGSGHPQRASFPADLFLSRPGYPGAAAAPCRAWVAAFLSRSRAADEELLALPPAPSHHSARPVGPDRRVA